MASKSLEHTHSPGNETVPLREMGFTFEEDEFGYVDVKDKRISKVLISQLPSHQPDLLTSGPMLEEASDHTLRRRQSHYRTMKLKNATLTSHPVSTDVDKIYELLIADPDTTEEETMKTLREMHQSLTVKRQVKKKLDADKKERVDKVLDVFTRFKLQMHMVWHKILYELKNMSYSLEPWHSPIKEIQGRFGSGVASYFIFLRWLLYINLFNFLVFLCFLITPQLIYVHSSKIPAINSTSEVFSAADLITGSGWLTNSLMYFGYYSSEILQIISGLYYNMPLAYISTIGVNSAINLVAVSYSLTSSYQKSYIDAAGDVKHIFCNKVFSAWDYSIETEDAAKLRKIAFCNEIKELLSFMRREEKKKKTFEKLIQIAIMFLLNILCLAVSVAVGYLIYFLLEKKALEVSIRILGDMTLSLSVTFISTTFYFLLKYCTRLEFYFNRKRKLYLTMIRVVILRTVMLGVIVYFWIIINSSTRQANQCYETELGKEIYRLILVNFMIALIFFTFFGEFIRKVISKYIFTTVKLSQFDVAYNTLDLIYYQTLLWLGVFCMPLAPLLNIVILVLLFYIKQNSVLMNCQPPRRTWSVNEAQTFFLSLVFFLFVLSTFTVGYMIFAIAPSSCGPFKGLKNAGELIHYLLFPNGKEYTASEVIKYLSSPGVMFAIVCTLCVMVYYMRAQALARIAVVQKLRERLMVEAKDKVFLLKLFEEALALHSQKNADNINWVNKDSATNENPSSDITQEVFFNEGYTDYYHCPVESPLRKNLEMGYIPANVPVNKQHPVNDSANSSRIDARFRSPSNSVTDIESPIRKPKGIHIPAHQPGFRHFHDNSPKNSEHS